MLTSLQFQILKRFFPEPAAGGCSGSAYEGRSKLEVLLGENFFSRIEGKNVVDFGCGEGADAIEMARRGARRVIGVDVREDVLQTARQRARAAGVETSCIFLTPAGVPKRFADVLVSVDAFEHFENPLGALLDMHTLLRPGGEAIISFGPTWYHPLGGHLFSVFPWAHLIFSEEALMRWRSTFKTDGAARFHEVAGGLNQMTIRRFEALVAESPFRVAALELAPVRKLRRVHFRLTREFTTAVVRCRLIAL
ncbi:MAG: class I SAM-dependent methyltransferase [Bryobacterales bacterium]|nr:class I SAM-dependent methyltransferase [Bryobacterales bacterium]